MPKQNFPMLPRNFSPTGSASFVQESIGSNYLQGLSYQKWLKDTHIALAHRGEHLQALDRAIRDYCSQRFDSAKCLETTLNLQDAFSRWALRKAGDFGISNAWSVHDPKKVALWKKDRRNHSGAMTRLYEALYTEAEKQGAFAAQQQMSQAEREAVAYMEECTKKLAAKLFAGKTCEFRFLAKKASAVITKYEDTLGSRELAVRSSLDSLSDSIGGHRESLVERAQEFVETHRDRAEAAHALATTISDGLTEIHDQIGAIIDAETGRKIVTSASPGADLMNRASTWLRSMLMKLVPSDVERSAVDLFIKVNAMAFAKTVKSLMPVVGAVQGIGSGLVEVAKAQMQIRSAESIDAHRFSKGESAALAIEAVTRLMREQGRSKRTAALRQTASATAQTLISVIPGAQVAGSGASLASALIELLILFKEFMEDRATRDEMNRYLAKVRDPDTAGSTVDDIETGRELFAKFPLLGAYWVMIADTSSVIGICAEDLTASNFMQQVEQISRTHMEKLRSAAADLIAESSLVIPELSAHRLIVTAQSATPYSTTWSSMTESIKRSVRGWSIHKKASGMFPPPAWKSRVIGVGSDEYFAAQDAQGKR